MKQIAVEQAKSRFERATSAFAEFRGASNFGAFQSAWSEFLISANGIYSKLEQGAKGEGTSGAWFGRKVFERRQDQLLQYLHHARNADEHGLAPTAILDPGSFQVKGSGHYRLDGVIRPSKDTHIEVTHIGGPPPIFEVRNPCARLVPVRDRGITYNPPTKHLGKLLDDKSPAKVAKLSLTYFDQLIEEAASLSKHSR